jgi:hypothetical protein
LLLQDLRARPQHGKDYVLCDEGGEQAAIDALTAETFIQPEEVCQYEKMMNSLYHLKEFGLEPLVHTDKMKTVLAKVFRNNPDDFEG